MDYGSVLSRAWRITWKHQAMWLYGLMAVWSFPGILINLLIQDAQSGLTGLFSALSFGAILWASFLWALISSLVAALIHSFGRSALVFQVGQSEAGIEPSVRSGWEGGVRYFLRVVVITFLTALPVIMVVFGIMAIALRTSFQFNWQQVQPDAMPDMSVLNTMCGCFAPLACLSVPLGIAMSTIQFLATRVCVLQDEGIWQSIVAGWQFLRDNLGSVLMFWGIWLLIGIGVLLVMMIPLCLLSSVVGGLALLRSGGTSISDMVSGSVWMNLAWWVIMTVVNSLAMTFYSTAWTLFYQDLSVPEQPEEATPALDQAIL